MKQDLKQKQKGNGKRPYVLAVCGTQIAAERCRDAAIRRGEYAVWCEEWKISYTWPPMQVHPGGKE